MGRPAGQPRCPHRLHAAPARAGPGSDRGELCVLPRGFVHSFVNLSRSRSGRREARPAAGGVHSPSSGGDCPRCPHGSGKPRTRRSVWGAGTGQARDRKDGLLCSARCCFVCTSHPRPGRPWVGPSASSVSGVGGQSGAVRGPSKGQLACSRVSPVACPSLVPTQVVKWFGQTQCLRLSPDPGARQAESISACLWGPAALAVCALPAGPVLFSGARGRETRHLPDCGVSQGCWPGRRFGGRDPASGFQTGLGAGLLCGSPVGSLCGSGGRYRAGPPRTCQACSVVGSLQWLC